MPMKVLVISSVKTHPTDLGSSKFIVEYCNLIRSLGHDVYFLHIVCYAVNKGNIMRIERDRQETAKIWGDHYYEYKESLFSFIRRRLLLLYRKYFCKSYLHCDDKYYIGLASYVQRIVRKDHIDACLVNYFWLTRVFLHLDIRKKGIITHDAYSFYRQRNPNIMTDLNLRPEEEAKALQRCDYVFAMQDKEATLFNYLAPKSIILKSYCSSKINIQPQVGNHHLLFFSSEWQPNILGLQWFLHDVFPHVRDRFPDCKLVIGGSICTELKWLNEKPGIELLGYVGDPADFYRLGDVVINPTFSGAGLKIKTIEAISFGKVVVSHPHSVEGIFCKDKAPVLVAEDPEEWVGHFEKCWHDNSFIGNMKDMDRAYLHEMNQFILSQYQEFLSECK